MRQSKRTNDRLYDRSDNQARERNPIPRVSRKIPIEHDHVLHFLALDGALDDGELKVRPMVLPDKYFETATQHEQYDEAGLNHQHIRGTILRLAKRIQVPVLQED